MMLLFVSLSLMFAVSLFLSKTILSQWFDPTFVQTQQDRTLIELRTKVDSLQMAMVRRDMFMRNVEDILAGVDGKAEEEEREELQAVIKEKDLTKQAAIDSAFRADFANVSLDDIEGNVGEGPLSEMSFFKPADGMLSGGFDPAKDHFGVDIVAKKDEPIKVVADGTVLMATWTQATGNVLLVQHSNNMISVYKHNAALLATEGQHVQAGDIIAIMGNSGELTTGPHLHFEIWLNGHAANPVDFIAF